MIGLRYNINTSRVICELGLQLVEIAAGQLVVVVEEVIIAFRRQEINTSMMHLVLNHLARWSIQ